MARSFLFFYYPPFFFDTLGHGAYNQLHISFLQSYASYLLRI